MKKKSNTNSIEWLKYVVGGVLGAGIALGVNYTVDSQHETVSKADVESIVNHKIKTATSQASSKEDGTTKDASLTITTDVSDIVKKVEGSVVSVINLTKRSSNGFYDLFGFADPSASQNTNNSEEDYETYSEGSGVVYKIDGDKAYIVTNNHVIQGQDAVEVILNDGTKAKAEVLGSDTYSDLAVLTIPAAGVKGTIAFGDSNSLQVGEPAIAIGSPISSEYASTVTYGIISALDRQVPVDINRDGKVDWKATAIQTDAAINPGNSGGALVNSAGQLIGINSMKISSENIEGIGFAIPSNEVKKIIEELESTGKVTRPELGISMADLYQISLEEQKRVLKLPTDVTSGVVVTDITNNGPAYKAGLEQYDVITRFNGEPVDTTMKLRQSLYQAKVNDKVEVEFYRAGEKKTLTIQLQAQNNAF